MLDRIESTIDYGRAQFSYGGLCYGSVNSYNNFFTKFFAWLFNWSVYVVVGNKERALNKWDYASWLREHTGDSTITAARVHEFVNFGNFNRSLIAPPEGTQAANQCLSTAKVTRLSTKLIEALYRATPASFEKAALYILRGASLNTQFTTRGVYGISYYAELQDIEARPTELTIRKYSPLLLAADHKQTMLVQLMRRCGANTNYVGKEIQFVRSVVDYENRSRLETSIGYHLTRRRNLQPVVHLDQRNTTLITLEDRKTPLSDLVFNANTNSLERRRLENQQPEVRTFQIPLSDYRYRLL